ncbi:MAG: transposase, partial [Planctomycetes bacterium]|nr:transposase [Planctomycetota bacterium]
RLAKRLTRHRDPLLTFLHKPEVPASNHFDERQIRPAVLIRKISHIARTTASPPSALI